MAQRSHVPKFGNWDSENVPYTTYFENARKDKGTGAKMINPNDPEENPDAFKSGMEGHENDGSHNVVRAPPSRFTSDKMMPLSHTQQKISLGQHNIGNRKSINSESASDRSNSDHSLLQPNHHRTRSSQKKSMGEGSNSFSPASPPARLRSGNQVHIPQRVASVPKFGAWDETDPKSGEGFTVIFNKVKEEKQIGASKLPTLPPKATDYSNGQRNHGSSSSRSKSCCCFF